MPFVLFAAFKVWHLFVFFFSDLHGRLDLELVPELLYFSTVRRVFASVVLLPPSTADVACPRFVRTMAFPNHVEVFYRLDFISPYAIGDNIDASRVISLRFSRGITSFFCCCCWTSPCPLAYVPFVVGPFFLLGALLPTTDVAAL